MSAEIVKKPSIKIISITCDDGCLIGLGENGILYKWSYPNKWWTEL